MAELGCAAALNNKIGYDQYQRTTYWAQLKKVGYDPSKIETACEEDCSAGVAANVKAVGYILGIKALQNVSENTTTRNMKANLKAAGFTLLTDSKYLTSGKYLLPGDILLYENHHAATNITKGSKTGSSNTPTTPPTKPSTPEQVIGTAKSLGSMYIRNKASTSGKSLGVVQKGAKLNVVEILDGWYKVEWSKSPTGYGYTSNRGGKYYKYEETKLPSSTKKATKLPDKTANSLAGDYITTGNLNIRNGAGTGNSVMVIIPKGTEVYCDGSYSMYNGTKWLYVNFTYKNIKYYGFGSTKYLKKQ